MPICMIFTPPKDVYDKETYDSVIAHVGESFPPSSMSLHLMGSNDQGEIRIVDIFESEEAFRAFAESHRPIYEELGVNLDDLMPYIQFFEVERNIG